MWRLTNILLFPKPDQQQKESTCLRVLCDATYHALFSQLDIREVDGVQNPVNFLEKHHSMIEKLKLESIRWTPSIKIQ